MSSETINHEKGGGISSNSPKEQNSKKATVDIQAKKNEINDTKNPQVQTLRLSILATPNHNRSIGNNPSSPIQTKIQIFQQFQQQQQHVLTATPRGIARHDSAPVMHANSSDQDVGNKSSNSAEKNYPKKSNEDQEPISEKETAAMIVTNVNTNQQSPVSVKPIPQDQSYAN